MGHISFPEYESFSPHNGLRLCLLLLLAEVFQAMWIVEQPGSSMLRFHPRVLDTFSHLRVTYRHFIWSYRFVSFFQSIYFLKKKLWGNKVLISLLLSGAFLNTVVPRPDLKNLWSTEAWSIRWFMGTYGGKTPKPHIAWSNSSRVGLLWGGKLLWNYRDPKYIANKTTKPSVSKTSGKKQFSGRKEQLKESGYHVEIEHVSPVEL